jgi:cytoskeletal protein CcmA (bactofilin family)
MSIFGGRKQQPPSQASSFPPPPPASPAHHPVGFDTVLGANATLKGDLKCQGNVRLDGTFEGTLEIEGNVLVGETAKITSDISAKNVSIAGAVRGNVSGKKVQLLRTARVWGDITATAIATEEGAFIDGKITMITHDAAQAFDPSALMPPQGVEEFEQPAQSESPLAGDRPQVETGEEQASSPD